MAQRLLNYLTGNFSGSKKTDAAGPELATFSRKEVATHCDETSTWIVLHNKVYDVSKFMYEHPGGEEVILQWAGQDATDG